MSKKKPLALIILDGWGYRTEVNGNAVNQARTPNFERLWKTFSHSFLETSGEAVGLPSGVIGNSEVGHLNIGAGRVVLQDLVRIHKAIRDKSFFQNEAFTAACEGARESTLHLLGLCSDVGVHSHLDHLFALLDFAKSQGVKEVFIHAITDGRDASPTSGEEYLRRLEEKVAAVGNARIATVSGRYYAMDRDKRWDRTAKAWRCMVLGEGEHAASSVEAITRAYETGITDEFVKPTVIGKVATIADGDAAIFSNFRADRARQMTRALAFEVFTEFSRPRTPKLSPFVCMTQYDKSFNLPIAFPEKKMKNILGEVLSHAGLKQLRIAETEKYAHVTYFFNGGIETPFPGEDRLLVPSPRDVTTYDLKPEMSARALTHEVLKRIEAGEHDVIILNFANPDMVGHTGNIPAAVKAVEVVDHHLGQIVERVLEKGGELLVTADHGNAEEMLDADGGPNTAHTMNPVPCLFVSQNRSQATLHNGRLCDLAPTMLALLGLEVPIDMTGKPLASF